MEKNIRAYSFWDRVKLGYQAFKIAKRMPFKLVTGTEVEMSGGIRPSDLEGAGVMMWINYVDEDGISRKVKINPFSFL